MKSIILFLNSHPRIAKLLMPLGLIFLFIITCAVKINDWSIKHPILGKIGYYLFFFVTFPFKILQRRGLRDVLYWAIKNNSPTENSALTSSYIYLKEVARDNKWKFYISKTWFFKTMHKYNLRAYEAFKADGRYDYSHFMNMIEIYWRYGIPLGGGRLNNTSSTTIKVE